MKLREILDSPGFQSFQSDKLGNNLFINDPERADRLHKHAANGEDGSLHAEVIEDWREYVESMDIDDNTRETLTEQIDDVETRLEEYGMLYQLVTKNAS